MGHTVNALLGSIKIPNDFSHLSVEFITDSKFYNTVITVLHALKLCCSLLNRLLLSKNVVNWFAIGSTPEGTNNLHNYRAHISM